jgi:hypothetical protein
MRPGLVLILGTILLAGCGEIPQPFRHEGPPSSLARPKLGRGVTVRPVDGLPMLSEALVKSLEEREIPATVTAAPSFGHVVEAEAIPGGLAWSLKAPDGEEITAFRQVMPPSAWSSPDRARLKRSADEVVAVLAAKLADPDAQPRRDAPTAELARPKIRIDPMAGLPGDGDKALTGALARALEAAGMEVVSKGAAYVLRGVVTVGKAKSGDDLLAVSWQLRRAVGGTLMASIDQEGEVPKGRLSQPWGGLARDVAEGGAAGIIQIIRTAEREGRAAPEPMENSPPSRFTEIRPAAIGRANSSEPKSEARPTPQRPTVAIKAPPKVSPKKPVPAKAVKPQPKPKPGVKAGPVKAKKGSSPKSPVPRTPKVPAR